MSPEDKGSAMGSYEGAAAGKSDEGTSLAARRARLRGSLAKHAAPVDPYSVASPVGETPQDEGNASDAPNEKESNSSSPSASTSQTTTEEPMIKESTTSEPPVPVATNKKSSQTTASEPPAALPQPAAQTATVEPDKSTVSGKSNGNAESKASPAFGDRPFSFTFDEVAKEKPSDMSNKAFEPEPVGEILNSIDQGLSACAMNLANMQKLAGEQTEALKSLSDTLQNQTFAEIGLTLNSLMESLSAALEPMKAVSELVPAIDSLVTMLENKDSSPEGGEKMSPDQLVMSLADQLSAGMIDPWTFKCAYMAVYPAEHPADLLHRLVDLLGTQRISGDLFRAAYDAVQSAEGPARLGDSEGGGTVRVVQDPNLTAELERIRRSHDELSSKFEQRERELQELIGQKDQELEEQKQLLTSRWEEFNARYDELSETLHKRDEMLEQKEGELTRREEELARKETENQQLKAQLEELRDQTKEMVNDFQRQLSEARAKKEEQPAAPKPQSSFFDVAPQTAASPSLFDAAPPGKPLFEPQAANTPAPGAEPINQTLQMPQQQVQLQPQPQPQPQPPVPQQPVPVPPPPAPPEPVAVDQAIPRPQPTTPFVSGPGSYGSGVRAQVFEVIVRQALAGAPWREICAGPMQVNNITPEEVEAEVKRRQALLKK